MPVSVGRSPFKDDQPSTSDQQTDATIVLRTPQARVLAVLMPTNPAAHPINWPVVTRAQLGVRAGYTALSGSITRALNGIHKGSSSGDAHLGLLSLGLVEEIILDIDGVKEVNYRTTLLGIQVYQQHIAKHKKLPALRDAKICTNDRYKTR